MGSRRGRRSSGSAESPAARRARTEQVPRGTRFFNGQDPEVDDARWGCCYRAAQTLLARADARFVPSVRALCAELNKPLEHFATLVEKRGASAAEEEMFAEPAELAAALPKLLKVPKLGVDTAVFKGARGWPRMLHSSRDRYGMQLESLDGLRCWIGQGLATGGVVMDDGESAYLLTAVGTAPPVDAEALPAPRRLTSCRVPEPPTYWMHDPHRPGSGSTPLYGFEFASHGLMLLRLTTPVG